MSGTNSPLSEPQHECSVNHRWDRTSASSAAAADTSPILEIIHVRPRAQRCSGMLKPPGNVIYESRGVQAYTFSLPMRTNKSLAAGLLKPEGKLSAAKLTKIKALELPSWKPAEVCWLGKRVLANAYVLTSLQKENPCSLLQDFRLCLHGFGCRNLRTTAQQHKMVCNFVMNWTRRLTGCPPGKDQFCT